MTGTEHREIDAGIKKTRSTQKNRDIETDRARAKKSKSNKEKPNKQILPQVK